MALNKRIIVNVAIGDADSWYHRGQARLFQSIKDHTPNFGYVAANLISKKTPLEAAFPYEEKIAAVKYAAENGYTKILWLDCSIMAIRPLNDIWNYIEKNGYYLYKSGENACQTANDNALNFYGISRDTAELYDECASNVVGLNLDTEVGFNLYNLWISSLNGTANRGVKFPTGTQRLLESEDPRFKYARQDQSTLSLSAAKLGGLKMEDHNHFVYRDEAGNVPSETAIFKLKGGY